MLAETAKVQTMNRKNSFCLTNHRPTTLAMAMDLADSSGAASSLATMQIQ